MLLTLLVFAPFLFSLILVFFPQGKLLRLTALIFSLFEFVLSLWILKYFDSSTAEIQFAEKFMWISQWGVSYFLGVDGISIWLVLLTTFLAPLMILASWNSIDKKIKGFHSCIFLLQTAMLGTFLSLDLVLFYVFWELSLIPMYFIIGIWGGERRLYASIKFFVFTMLGSVLMLVGIIYLMLTAEATLGGMTSNLLELYRLKLPFISGTFANPQTLLFFAFSLAFAIKVPMFPFHTWLPDAHVEAPTAGSVVLAGVMLKMGTYGFLRFVLPLFPEASQYWAWLFMLFGVIGIIYGAFVAMVQSDIKKLVAYSSVSHMGYVVIGLFAMNVYGITGALYQMLNHGISTGALFFLVGMIYERTHSRKISDYGGLAKVLPLYSIFFFIVTLSSIAVPMTNGFIGEFLILLGTYSAKPIFSYISVFGVIFGAVYMLWMFKKVFYGPPGKLMVQNNEQINNHECHVFSDLCFREYLVLVPLVIMIFWMGLAPNYFLNVSKTSISYWLENKSNYQLVIKPGSK